MDNLPERPSGITLLLWLLLILSIMSALRFIQSLMRWEILGSLLPLHPLYLSITGFLGLLSGTVIIWGLWRRAAWAPLFTRLFFVIYSFYYWSDRLLLTNPTSRKSNSTFAAVITVLILGWIIWLFSRESVKKYFGEIDDRRPKDSKTA